MCVFIDWIKDDSPETNPVLKVSCKYFYLLMWLCWVFVAVCGPSLLAASGGYSLVEVRGPLIAVASLVSSGCRTQCGSCDLPRPSCPVAYGILVPGPGN